jgi:hypothetical protein
MLGRILKSLTRTAAVTADAASLSQCCPALLTTPAAATGLGMFVLLVAGTAAYNQYRQHLQAKNQEALKTFMEQFERDHTQLKSAAERLTIGADGTVDFSQLSPKEQSDPHILLFKLLSTKLDENLVEPLEQSISQQMRMALNIKLARLDIADFRTEIGADIDELKPLLTAVQQDLNNLTALYTGANNHRPPLQVPWVLDEENRESARFLTKSRWTPLIGRDTEMGELRAFLELREGDTRKFQWWLWTGSGGQGKSEAEAQAEVMAVVQKALTTDEPC